MKKILTIGLISLITLPLTGCFSISINNNGIHKASTNLGKQINQTLATKPVDKLKLSSNNTDIQVKTGDSFKVAYKGGKRLLPTIKQSGNTLTITEKSSLSINIGTEKNWPTIVVTLPKKQLDSIYLKTDDGNIYGSSINAKHVTLSSDDGDIKLDNLIVDSGKIKLSDGDAKLKKLSSEKGFSIFTSDGDVKINKNNATGFSIDTDDGDIHVGNVSHDSSYEHNVDSKNVLNISTNDGDVTID